MDPLSLSPPAPPPPNLEMIPASLSSELLNSLGIRRSTSNQNYTEAEKQVFAKTLWNVVQKHNDKAFSHFIKEPSLLERIWEQFLRFLRWLFRMPHPLSNEELRLRYAMHLFNNHQPNILEQGAATGEDQIPFSICLETQCHYLRTCQAQLAIPTHKLEALEQCLQIAKLIEKARESSLSSRQSIVKDLSKTLQQQIDKLAPGESLCFPGGLMDYHDLSDLLTGKQKKDFTQRHLSTTHMIYEIVKNPPSSEKNLTFRMYHYSTVIAPLIQDDEGLTTLWAARDVKGDSLNEAVTELLPPDPMTEYALNTEEFLPHLDTLLDVQTTPHLAHNMSKWAFFWYQFDSESKRQAWQNRGPNTLAGRIQGIWQKALGPLLEDLSIYRLANTLNTLRPYKREMSIIEGKVNLSPQTDPLTTIFVFSKATNDPKRHFRQLVEKTTLFLEIYDASQHKLNGDFQLCEWLSGNAIHLIKSYKHIFQHIRQTELEEYKNLLKYFEDIVKLLQEKKSHRPFALPPNPEKQITISSNFNDQIAVTNAFTEPTSYNETHVKSPGNTEPLEQMELSSENPWASLEEGLRRCDELSQQYRFQELHFLLKDIAYALENGDEARIWERIPIDQTEKWSIALHRLTTLSAQVHFGGHLPGPLPKQMAFLLKNLLRCQQLAYLNNAVTSFQGFALDMEPFKDVLRDPYLDLGEEGPTIKKTIDAIEQGGAIQVNLTDPSRGDDQQVNDKAFFDAYKRSHPTWRDSKETRLESDFTGGIGKLALQVVHLRRMKILTLAMVARYRCLGNKGLWATAKTSLMSCLALLRGHASNFDADILQRFFSEIDANLKTAQAPNTMVKNNLILHDRRTIWLEEYGLDFFDYYHPPLSEIGLPFASQRAPSQYKKTGPEVPPPLAEGVIEACVTNEDTIFADEDGFTLDPKQCTEIQLNNYVPSGETKSEGTIYSDHTSELSLMHDRWADLRAMQTKPSSTRIFNTLTFFHQNFGYLGHPKYGKAFQRLFALNLFRNNALGNYLKAFPEKLEVICNYIVTIAQSLRLSNDLQGMLFMLSVTDKVERILEDQDHSISNPQILALMRKEHVDQLTIWQEQCEKQQQLSPHRYAIHHTFLLHFAHILDRKFKNLKYNPLNDPEVEPYLLKILRSHFLAKQIALPPQQKVRAHEDTCNYMMHRLFPVYRTLLHKDHDRNSFLNQLFNINDENTSWKPLPDPFCYESGHLQVDLWGGLLYVNHVATCYLPDVITYILKQLYNDETVHAIACQRKNIEKDGLKGGQYDFKYRNESYQVVLLPGQDPLIYKWIELPSQKPMWMQFTRINSSSLQNEIKNTLITKAAKFVDPSEEAVQPVPKNIPVRYAPSDLTRNLFWINSTNERFKVENEEGQLLYFGHIKQSEKTPNSHPPALEITQIYFHANNHIILNPWESPEFQHFQALAKPTEMLALGASDKVHTIKYLDFPLEYHWEEEYKLQGFIDKAQNEMQSHENQSQADTTKTHSNWASSLTGYYLSTQRMHNFKPQFFTTSFQNYHILTHQTKPPKLLLVGYEYTFATPLHAHHKELKKVDPVFTEPPLLYTYDIDMQEGLLSESPEGYLYLAYLLFTQSNYDEALHYLYKAQNVKPGESKNGDAIFEWFGNWKSTSKRSQQFLLHVWLLKLMQLQRFDLHALRERQSLPLLQKVAESFSLYVALETSYKLDPMLLLSYSQRALLRNYLELIAPELIKSLENASTPLRDLPAAVKQFQQVIKQALSEDSANRLIQEAKIDVEINQLKSEMKANEPNGSPQTSKQKKTENTQAKSSFYIFAEHKLVTETCLPSTDTTNFTERMTQLKDTIDEMLKSPHSEDGEDLCFARELAEKLFKDTEEAAKEQLTKIDLDQNIDPSELKSQFQKAAAKKEEEATKKKKDILDILGNHSRTDSPWSAMLQKLKRSPEASERYFREALHCCATGDWRALEKAGIVHPLRITDLTKACNKYLISKTASQQYHKVVELLELHQKTLQNHYMYKMGLLLATKRYYNPETHPYRFNFLLLELQQKIILTKDQVQNIISTTETPNLFKHHLLGGGKTTVLRNENANFFANGSKISGVITDDALIGIHHPLLQETSLEAFGKLATRLTTERNDRSDALAWKVKLRNILRVTTSRGWLDTTPDDMLSLYHSPKEKLNELKNPKREIEDIHHELDIICEISQEFQARGILGADEADDILRPNVQRNWGTGNERGLDLIKCEAALKIVEWSLSDETYKTYFKTNTQYELTLSKEKLQNYLRMLAEHIYDEYMTEMTSDKELAIAYLIKPLDSKNDKHLKIKLDKLYEDHLKPNSKTPHRNLVVSFHKYLHSILRQSLELRNGTRYMRANNGRDVKPTCRNATYNPNSERCSEEASILDTCWNYMDITHENSGVTVSQIAQLVIDLKRKASKAVLDSLKRDKKPLKFEETAVARDFFRDFNYTLQDVASEDYPAIVATHNEDPKKLTQFLRNYVLPATLLKEKKWEGNAHDLVNMVSQFYGTSGTSNNYRSLPNKIYIDPKLSGSDGSVLCAILKDFETGDIIPLPNNKDPTATIVSHIAPESIGLNKPGNLFMDLAAIYPGMTGEKIAKRFTEHLTPDHPVRYINESEGEMVKTANDKEPRPFDPINDLMKVTTVLANSQERGTNLEMVSDGIEYTTVNNLTNLTEFMQASKRLRNLGKGGKCKFFTNFGIHETWDDRQLIMMIIMLCKNEARQLKVLHFLKEEERIENKAKSAIYNELIIKLKDRELRLPAWSAVEHFFTKDTQESLSQMGKPQFQQTAHDYLKSIAQKECDKVHTLQTTLSPFSANFHVQSLLTKLKEVEKELKELSQGIGLMPQKYLPEYVDGSDIFLETVNYSTSEQMGENFQDTFQHQSQMTDQKGPITSGKAWKPIKAHDVASLASQLLQAKENGIFVAVNTFAPLYDDNLFVTWNIDTGPMIRSFHLILLIHKETHAIQGILGTKKDMDHVFTVIDTKEAQSPDYDYYIYNITTGALESHLTHWQSYPQKIFNAINKLIAQCKLLTGDINLDTGQLDDFKDWLETKGPSLHKDAKQLEKQFRTQLNLHRPSLIADYPDSAMAQALRKV